MVRVIGPKAVAPGESPVSRRNIRAFTAAMLILWVSSDWPIHDISEDYLYWVHMFQHMALSFFVPPLALIATPAWLLRTIVGQGAGYLMLKRFCQSSIDGVDIPVTTKKESEIQEILDEWVPEHLHGNFNLADEAAKLRKNPLYKTEFKEKAKNARFAEYSMYDKDIDWKTIEARGVALVESSWGIVPKSDNPILKEVIKMNDTNKANEYLRTEGLKVGNEKVKNDYAKAVAQAYGDNIVRSAGFTEGR